MESGTTGSRVSLWVQRKVTLHQGTFQPVSVSREGEGRVHLASYSQKIKISSFQQHHRGKQHLQNNGEWYNVQQGVPMGSAEGYPPPTYLPTRLCIPGGGGESRFGNLFPKNQNFLLPATSSRQTTPTKQWRVVQQVGCPYGSRGRLPSDRVPFNAPLRPLRGRDEKILVDF